MLLATAPVSADDAAGAPSSSELDVEIGTSDLRGAGTTAGVWLAVHGERGATWGPRQLGSEPHQFQRGCVDR